LTGEAVDQIDQVLENLLQFTRFGAPDEQRVSVESIVSAAFADLQERFGVPTTSIERETAPNAFVLGDLGQLAYALANLLYTLTRDRATQEVIRIRYPQPGSIVIAAARLREDISSRLSRMLSDGEPAESGVPLGVALASAIIERNGGALRYEPNERPATATVELRVVDAEDARGVANGTSTRSGH
jgi:K+-sensing histidine kinase KdpD